MADDPTEMTEDDRQLLGEVERVSPFTEIGDTGLKRYSGFLDEEFLPQLRGRKGVAVYKEMDSNDPIIGALMFAIRRLLQNVEWNIDPNGKSKAHSDNAKLLETAKDDMEHSWAAFIEDILSFLVYGWSMHEPVYKRRGGLWATDPRHRSKHSDGLVGWRKIPIRSQDTLLRWLFDDRGDVVGMVQMAPPQYKNVTLPMGRMLHFTYGSAKGSPEGISMLRNAYRPWFMKKRLEEIEAVGIERDLAGLPIVKVPAKLLAANAPEASKRQVAELKKMVKSLRRNEQEGVVFPQEIDQDTKQPLYSLELLGGGGSRNFNVDGTIRRYEERMLMTVLADFILVGHQGVGTYSMHTDKSGIFRSALNYVLEVIAEVLNREAVPRLFKVNGITPSELPRLVPSDVDAPDLTQLATFMQSMAGMGVSWFPDANMEKFVRAAARLPELDDDEQERRRQMRQRAEETAFASQNTEYITALQTEQQTEAGEQPGGPNDPAAAQQAAQAEAQTAQTLVQAQQAAQKPAAGAGAKR